MGILFKSASTRGGTIENIVIHDMDMHGVATPISVTLNWNPSYSYAKMPQGLGPAGLLAGAAEAVPPEKGLPHLRNVQISGIRAVDAQRAFAVSSYADSPLDNFAFKDLEIDAQDGRQHSVRRPLDIRQHAHQDCRRQRGDAEGLRERDGVGGKVAEAAEHRNRKTTKLA